jgi:hypothetical protein
MTPLRIARQRRAELTFGVAALAALIVAVAVWPAGAPTGSMDPGRPSAAAAGVSPSDGAAVGSDAPAVGSNAPAVDDQETPWGELHLPPVPPAAATLIATKPDRDRVATTTAFTLTSLGRWSATDLARAVEVVPSIDLNVNAGADDKTATISPIHALDPGRLYRFTVRTPDGTAAGSWAFQAATPLHVVTTVPGDQSTKVPVDTGIEMTFDQDGAIEVASHFSIEPSVKGAFEQHGRTVVFVPEDPLKPATLYTVVVTRGASLEGSDQVLDRDLQVRFETAPIPPPSGVTPERPFLWFGFDRSMIEVRPNEHPALAVEISASSTALRRAPFAVRVYRLSSEAAGIDAVHRLTVAPYWATWSKDGLVSTDGLTRVASFTAHPKPLGEWGESTFVLPTPLEAGWYLVEIPRPDRSAQTVIQVTDLAAYAAVATDRLLVWANDVASGAPLAGASVAIIGGAALGLTDADGLLVARTPAAVRAAASRSDGATAQQLAIRTADGRSLVLPVGMAGNRGGYLSDVYGYGENRDVAADYWRFLATDRGIYRRTDTINVWGYIRSRDGAGAPDHLSLVLMPSYLPGRISETPVKVDRSGAFVASIALDDLPHGGYTVELIAGDVDLGSVWVTVEEIRKPSYRLELTTDRHVLVVGDPITATARAAFFDGTPVPGVDLQLDLFGTPRTATTDRTGSVTLTAPAQEYGYLAVQPARSEEAEIRDGASVRVFPSSVMIDAQATIAGRQIDLAGTLNQVAIQRLEAAWPAEDWSVDPKGSPVSKGAISVEVIERVAVVIKTTHLYDFVSKRVVDTYDYRWDEVSRFSRSLTSGADGSFGLQFAVEPKHDYEIIVSARDDAGRQFKTWVWARGPERPQEGATNGSLVPYLAPQACRAADLYSYRVGDAICLQMENDAGSLPSGAGNRYLFFTAQRGLRKAVVQDSSLYSATFTADDVPEAQIWGVRFTGRTFTPVEEPHWARFDWEQRRLTVTIKADRKRYAPGQTVTLDLRTADLAGTPVSAAVILRAVDEKLYAIGGAYDPDPLSDLYGVGVESGLLWTHGSHPLPFARGLGGEGGDTMGGGDDGRREFADSVLFRKVTTNAAGHARVSFNLSDDLTSWHVSASATTKVPEAGAGSILVPVGLPFFVEATLAPEYLAGDRPTLRIRAYGSDLRPDDRVTYTVTSKSLGMPATIVRGLAFDDVEVRLPVLSTGERNVTISGSVQRDGAILSDRLTRRIEVVASRFMSTRTTYAPLTSGLRPEGGTGWTTYVFSDAGRGRYLSLLQSLNWSRGPRLDQALAATMARDLLVDAFSVDSEWLAKGTFEPSLYQRGDGVSLLPYSSADLALTARIALLAGDRFDQDSLAGSLQQVLGDPASTRERRTLAVAGLAGLGQPVLAELRLANADPSLTVRERLYLALGAAALGDDEMASAIERELLGAHGERRGPWIRLRVGGSLDDTIEATSLVALVAAHLGEPFAAELEAYVDANPAIDELYNLQQVAFVARMLDRTPSTAARFAYTVDGKRTVVDLEPGQSSSLALLGDQRKGLAFESLAGSVSVATTWQVPRQVSAIQRDPELTITRSVLPAGDLSSTGFVEVRLTAAFGSQVVSGCYLVTDLVPSGMAPVTRLQVPAGDDPSRFQTPFEIEAQRVSFCVWPTPKTRRVEMRYFARIVSPGEYVWEPAVIQSTAAAESISLTGVRRITVH